ncbi:MAG: fluoride efflux transporter CrcB [Candidatus Caenarcaniphilales bacterium]|nr:fluoride efflux transporter CrcB [Candidatus Caenarcaniphilales bacterium]
MNFDLNALKTPFLISLGAVFGALSRHYIGWLFQRFEGVFPQGTLFINLTGCFLAGLIVALLIGTTQPRVEEFRTFFVVGFLGSYTTFSAYALQSVLLLKSENYLQAFIYWFGSCSLGVISVLLGFLTINFLKDLSNFAKN